MVHRGRRPAVWTPGDKLAIDWRAEDGLHVFCVVPLWSRWRFVGFAADVKAATTLGSAGRVLLARRLLPRHSRQSVLQGHEVATAQPGRRSGIAVDDRLHQCGVCLVVASRNDGISHWRPLIQR